MQKRVRSLLLAAGLTAVILPACGGDDDVEVQRGAVAPQADVWAASSVQQALTHVDPDGNVAGTVDLCCRPRDVVVAAGSVWVSTDKGKLLRIDPATGGVAANIDVGEQPGLLAGDDRGIWISDGACYLVRVDPATNQIVARTPVGSEQALIVDVDLAVDAVWVTVEPAFGLVKVDPATNAVAVQTEICFPELCHFGAAAVGEHGVWVLDDTAGQLILVDPRTAAMGQRWSVGARNELRDLVATPEGLWINDTGRNTLLWVDPDDPDRSDPLDVTIAGPRLLRSADGAVWTHSVGSGEIVRIDPATRRVVARTPAKQISSYAIG